MKKINKISISLLALTLSCGVITTKLAKQEKNEFLAALAEEELNTNEFYRIATGWNPNKTLFDQGKCSYVLEFKNNWRANGESTQDNLVSQIGDHFTINGQTYSSLNDENVEINYRHGGKYLNIILPTEYVVAATNSNKCIIHIDDETPFYDLSIPEMTLTIELENYEMEATAKKVTSVDFKGIAWNKTNKDPGLFENKKGLLIGLGDDIYDGTSSNLLESSFGTKITLNGVAFKDLVNPEIKVYNSNSLWLYADNLNTVSSTYNKLEMHISKFNGKTISPFEYYLSNRSDALWNSYNDNVSSKSLELYYDSGTKTHGSAWPSNKVFENNPNRSWFCNGAYVKDTKDGYLLSFAGAISDTHSIFTGSHKYINLANEEAGHHFYSNGVPLSDIEGAELQYVQEGHIWIWTPTLYEPLPGKNHAELTVDSIQFFDAQLPELQIYHEDCKNLDGYDGANLWHVAGYDNYVLPKDRNADYLKLDPLTSSEDTWLGPYSWNNHDGDGTTLIAFGSNSADEKAHESDPTLPTTFLNKDSKGNCVTSHFNMSLKSFAIGWKLKLNGIPFWKIPETTINYQNGENYFTFIVKEKYCVAFNGYKVPTVTLDDGTNFFNVSLQGFSIYFADGKWHKTSSEYVNDDVLEASSKYSDVFDVSEFDSTVNETSGLIDSSKNSLTFEFRTESKNTTYAMNLFGSNNESGIQMLVDFHNESISLYDGSNVLLDGSKKYKLETSEWTRMYIKLDRHGATADILVALDDIVILKTDGFVLSSTSNFGNHMSLYTNDEKVLFRDSLIGQYIKSPELMYSGKEVLRFYAGEEFPDLTPYFDANDLLENVKNNVVIDVPNNMFDSENKLNKGEYDVEAYVINSSGSKKSQFIKVYVTEIDEAVVTFDGENTSFYKLGQKINKPTFTPTKESVNNISYEFLYWSNNGVEWDFENDYVTQDINLVSTFKEVVGEFTVTFEVSGLKDNSSFVMYLVSGATININMFEKEGYTLTMLVNNESVTSFTVSGDMIVKLEYVKEGNEKEVKKGCGGSIVASSLIASFISILGISLVLAKRKEDK